MRLRFTMFAVALLLVPVTMTAGATGGGKLDESLAWIDLRPVNGKLMYVAADGSIWEEVNGANGLQTARVVMGPHHVKEPDARVSGP